MKKAVAVPYIIAILLGIAVIGLIGYQLFNSSGTLIKNANVQSCTATKVSYCQDWSKINYIRLDTTPKPFGAPSWDTACTNLGVSAPSQPECTTLLSASLKNSGDSCTTNTECKSGTCKSVSACPRGTTEVSTGRCLACTTGTTANNAGKCTDGKTPETISDGTLSDKVTTSTCG